MLMLCFWELPRCGAKNTCKYRTLTWFNLFLSLMSLLGDGDGVNLAFNLAAALAMLGVGANSK